MKEVLTTATDPALTALANGWCALFLLHDRIEAAWNGPCRPGTP
ncbi:hypothetical protein GCM10010448_36820 [Streptomyces glomeratus]|uniref:MarR family transcriptional regulator n=1 Tax=Streptomyces glomeratus TaxID=284452 RepID=A0ABP6LLG4_9ACTN